jgi:demethylmenaquinone methyltransferase/2-methoxy-6-polyprenyl-1,4-benzoquinol methylase
MDVARKEDPEGARRHGWAVRPRLGLVPATAPPSRPLSRERYEQAATTYDADTASGSAYRDRAVRALAPRPGETILDVGCGTGLNLLALREAVGAEGRVVGIDLSPEMLAQARARIAAHGWRNVVLVEAAVEDVHLSVRADAALLCGTHDVMRSPAALDRVLHHLRPGGRVVAAGAKWAPWWWPAGPLMNAWTWHLNHAYVTTFEGFEHPWSHLARRVADLEVTEVFFGGGYIATGRVPERERGRAREPGPRRRRR